MNGNQSISSVSRREMLGGVLGAGVLATPDLLSARSAAPSLKKLASAKGIKFGSEIGGRMGGGSASALADPRYRDLVIAQCAAIVPENELKLYAIRPAGQEPDYSSGDAIVDFGVKHGLDVRGHTLLYNRDEFIPDAIRREVDTQNATQAGEVLRDYISKVASRYKGRIYSWDVVNETVDPDSSALRSTVFTKKLGFDALAIAFEAASSAVPGTQLVYNDYMSWGAGSAKHRAGVLALLADFRKRGVPVDALGIQSHIGAEGASLTSADRREWQTFVEDVIAMDYEILITEFDVNDRGLPSDIRERDVAVAAIARSYLDVMLSYRELRQFLCWGMVDRYSWLHGFAPRPDGLPQRGAPYDDDYQPKALRGAIADAVNGAPKR